MRVYIDLVVLLNFLVDLMLILGANRLSGHPPGLGRALPAAALGGVYSGACFLPGFRFLGSALWRVVFLGLMGALAFGIRRSGWKRCGLFMLLSMALGGIALAVGSGGFWMPVLSAAGIWLLCRCLLGSTAGGREYVPLEIDYAGTKVRLTALKDTGNSLRDPISGEQVMVIGGDTAAKLTGLTHQQLSHPLETMAAQSLSGLRLIPYRAVGQPGGMLLAMRFRDVTVGGRKTAAIIAFAPEQIGRGEVYQALTGGVI